MTRKFDLFFGSYVELPSTQRGINFIDAVEFNNSIYVLITSNTSWGDHTPALWKVQSNNSFEQIDIFKNCNTLLAAKVFTENDVLKIAYTGYSNKKEQLDQLIVLKEGNAQVKNLTSDAIQQIITENQNFLAEKHGVDAIHNFNHSSLKIEKVFALKQKHFATVISKNEPGSIALPPFRFYSKSQTGVSVAFYFNAQSQMISMTNYEGPFEHFYEINSQKDLYLDITYVDFNINEDDLGNTTLIMSENELFHNENNIKYKAHKLLPGILQFKLDPDILDKKYFLKFDNPKTNNSLFSHNHITIRNLLPQEEKSVLKNASVYFNLIIEDRNEKKYYKIALNENQIKYIVEAFLHGKEEIQIKGQSVNIKNPLKFIIFNIKDYLGDTQEQVEQAVKKKKILMPNGKASEHFFSLLGANVSYAFLKNKGWGSEKMTNDKKQVDNSMKGKNGKIFISHSSLDEEIVTNFCDLILDHGLGMNLDQDIFYTSLASSSPKSGEDFRDKIKSGLINAKAVLLFISKNYKTSPVCLNEMGAAWVLSNSVIPMIITPNEYETGLIHSTTQQVPLSKKDSILKFIDDHKGTFIPEPSNIGRLTKKIEEFIEIYEEKIQKKDSDTDKLKAPLKENDNLNIKNRPNKNDLFTINNRSGIFIFSNDEFRKIPDNLTEILLGKDIKELKKIEIEDLEKLGKIGSTFPSIYRCEFVKAKFDDSYYVIMNGKKRYVPDFENVSGIVRRRTTNLNLKGITSELLDSYDEDEPLYETKGKIE